MRFRIRFAYQIVGVLTLAGLLLLILVIFILGSNQRWFARDYAYTAYFESASGLSVNMPVLYKGFTIGNVKAFRLNNEDIVEVTFSIFNHYNNRVREGSVVDLHISPIGLGNQFVFYAGLGSAQLEAGARIPIKNSSEARQYIEQRLASVPPDNDKINTILGGVTELLDTFNKIARDVDRAVAGSGDSSLGRILGSAEGTMADVSAAAGDFRSSLEQILADLRPIAVNLKKLSDELADPQGTLGSILNSEGPVYTHLSASLEGLAGIIKSLDKTAAFIPTQLPQLGALILELRTALVSAEDVLTALANNPLLKNGIPQHAGGQGAGTSIRDVSF
ncbi:MAG: MlaD family protein [Treponema sp.]|jgi:phospholipid/cholesterol/gamma-HCH transport system substrate-binding protein|nr:MlaD family protein [Treponema sp.]